jgi:hypothetical protein
MAKSGAAEGGGASRSIAAAMRSIGSRAAELDRDLRPAVDLALDLDLRMGCLRSDCSLRA